LNRAAKRVTISDPSQTSEVRRAAQNLAASLGFDESKSGKIAIVVTEASTNLLKHAVQGEILLHGVEDPARGTGLEVLALDRGPGIPNLGESLRDGYSTAGSAGTGLGAIDRLADVFEIYSMPGQGTAILAQFWPRQSAVPAFEVSGLLVATEGEELCGDAWSHCAGTDALSVFVADGLGHGPLAQSAAEQAVQAYESNERLPPVKVLEAVHAATRSTRGAAVALAQIRSSDRTVRFAGIGNIAGVLAHTTRQRHMVSMGGIVGHEMRNLREFTYPWEPGSLMILHSDGLGTRWDLSKYPGLAHKPCALIAAVLWRDMVRGRDDSAVVVARETVQ